jgi:hypothetical protein
VLAEHGGSQLWSVQSPPTQVSGEVQSAFVEHPSGTHVPDWQVNPFAQLTLQPPGPPGPASGVPPLEHPASASAPIAAIPAKRPLPNETPLSSMLPL